MATTNPTPRTIGDWQYDPRPEPDGTERHVWKLDRKRMDGGTLLATVRTNDQGYEVFVVGNFDRLESRRLASEYDTDRPLVDVAVEWLEAHPEGADPTLHDRPLPIALHNDGDLVGVAVTHPDHGPGEVVADDSTGITVEHGAAGTTEVYPDPFALDIDHDYYDEMEPGAPCYDFHAHRGLVPPAESAE